MLLENWCVTPYACVGSTGRGDGRAPGKAEEFDRILPKSVFTLKADRGGMEGWLICVWDALWWI